MIIHQFYDKGLSHGSYAIIHAGKMIVVDPARDPQPYYDFAALNKASIVGIIETHPHADFISSHLEIHKTTGAVIYASRLLGAQYPHRGFDDGDVIELNGIRLKAINTPGHSPDSICILVEDENGNETALFSGDTLFVGDVGRPDLRENVGNLTAKKEELARQMYHSTRQKLMVLPHEVAVYPAHGPGSLCGKDMGPDLESTIGRELRENYALQLMDEVTFVKTLINDQPFIPKYFGYDVDMNKRGAPPFKASIDAVPRIDRNVPLENNVVIIDTRPGHDFKAGHLKGSINLQNGEKFETWLGSIISPGEQYYLVAATATDLDEMIKKAAKIGYEQNIKAALLLPDNAFEKSPVLDVADFSSEYEQYTIIDVRNLAETAHGLIFSNAINIPLPHLREQIQEIPVDKPIVAHCAAGYRSAAAASIIAGKITNVPVYDLGEAIAKF
jgi:glyoxylase-like metal-dependent hydrolase (beta-lactamase superfamily II)/rhodanese-related sulfurtransferase